MPELPEVETVRRGLESSTRNFTVKQVQVFDQRSIRKNKEALQGFLSELCGAKLNIFKRRGKFLWMPISNSRCLVAHLGMSGQILVRRQGEPEDRCERIRLIVEKGKSRLEVRFIDQRLFGGLHIDSLVESGSNQFVPETASHIALDPLEENFDLDGTASKLKTRNAGIKSLILNQEIVSGIGNIYADEILWRTKTHYLSSGSELSTNKLRNLLKTAQVVLAEAVEHGGTSFDAQYKNVNGESGSFSNSLNAYGQTGLPCKRCKTAIRRESWSNRGSHFCPKCQLPARPR